MRTFYIAILSISLSVAAQFSLKAGMSSVVVRRAVEKPLALRTGLTVLSNEYVIGGFLLYGLGALVWLLVLSRWDVSKAYPLVGMGFAVTMVVGLMLGEQVTLLRALGVALICGGVVLVSSS
jgi:multidrug transporter EmrE-like cation transporter